MADESKPTPRATDSGARHSSGSSSAADADKSRTSGARTASNTEAQQEEYAASGQNPALDNRTGNQRPGKSGWAPKPQQFPGPEVGHFAEHAEKYGAEFAKEFGGGDDDAEVGSTYGPHGRGDEGDTSSAGADGNPVKSR